MIYAEVIKHIKCEQITEEQIHIYVGRVFAFLNWKFIPVNIYIAVP